jgi:hypothetical protein
MERLGAFSSKIERVRRSGCLFVSFPSSSQDVQDTAILIGMRRLRGNDLHALNVVQCSVWQAGQ